MDLESNWRVEYEARSKSASYAMRIVQFSKSLHKSLVWAGWTRNLLPLYPLATTSVGILMP